MDMTDEMSKYNLKSSDGMTHKSQWNTSICHSGCLCIIPQNQEYLLLCPWAH
jgi:hypothetical protein